jgi:hypothetical protein
MQLLPFIEAAAAAAAASAAAAAVVPFKVDVYEGKVAIQWGEALSFDSSRSIAADDVRVRECDDFEVRGRGAFVARPGGLEKGMCLGQYTGVALNAAEYSARYAARQVDPDYVMRIDADLYLDASAIVGATDAPFHPAFINHARPPACNVIRRCASRRPPVVELFTAEALPQGTELLMDYGEDFWRGREAAEVIPN